MEVTVIASVAFVSLLIVWEHTVQFMTTALAVVQIESYDLRPRYSIATIGYILNPPLSYCISSQSRQLINSTSVLSNSKNIHI